MHTGSSVRRERSTPRTGTIFEHGAVRQNDPMIRTNTRGGWAIGAALMMAAANATAHSPIFDCFNEPDAKVTCEGGFSDGASAEGVSVRVLDQNEKVLISGKIDAEGRFTFERPAGEFHVIFDAGQGHSVTLFSSDIT